MDKDEILKQLNGIPEDVYDEIVLGFYEETRGRLKDISEAIGVFDQSALVRLAHGIKGSAANLRLVHIQEIAETLQKAAESNDQAQVIKSFELLKSLVPAAGK